MSAAGQPIDPVMALAAQQQAPIRVADPASQEFDPVQALAMGHVSAPTASPAVKSPNEQPSVFADMVRALPGGFAKGVSAIAGLPGDANALLTAGANAGLSALGQKPLPQDYGKPDLSLPISGEVSDAVSKPFGGYYKPQTIPGQYAETAASFAPNAAMPGTMAQKLARVLIPASASETAGQATKGTPFEGPARALGALVGGVGQGIGESALYNARNPAPTMDELGTAKTAAYKAADDAGVVISPQSFQQFATNAGSDLTREHVVQADIHPNTMAVLSTLQDEAASGAPISLSRADAIRQAINGAAEKAAGPNGSASDLRLVMKVKGSLDNYLDNLAPSDTLSGDASTAVPILKGARDLAQREFKGQQIQKMMDLAANSASTNYSASGYEQALRAQFKNLNAQFIKNPNMANGYSDAERAAIQNVAQGGPVGNALRYFGKFSAHGPVSAAAGMGIGAMLGSHVGGVEGAGAGGMVGAVGIPAIGELARSGATAITSKNARLAGELMRRGSELPSKSTAGTNALASLLLSQGVH